MMAEPSTLLWQALLDRLGRPHGRAYDTESRAGGASLVRRSDGRLELSDGWSEQDRTAFQLFAPLLDRDRLALAQLGQSLDGRIATASGDSYYINDRAMRAHLHRLRALVDAVVVGAGTAVADQPALTVRHCPGTSPVPVIIDPSARVPTTGPLFDPEQTPRLILMHCGRSARSDWPGHVESVRLSPEHGGSGSGLAPSTILNALAERGLRRVLIEGGGVTVSRFIDDQALDRVHLLIAPLLIGSGLNGLNLRPIERLSETPRRTMHSYALGDEFVVDVELRPPDDAPSRS